MGSGCRLPGGTGSRASRIVLSNFAGGGMSSKGSATNNGHLEHPSIYPGSQCFDCGSRAMIFWKFFLKIRQDTFGTINCPDG